MVYRPPGARNRPADAPAGGVGNNGVYKATRTPVGVAPKAPPPGAGGANDASEVSKSALKNKKRKEAAKAKAAAEKVRHCHIKILCCSKACLLLL